MTDRPYFASCSLHWSDLAQINTTLALFKQAQHLKANGICLKQEPTKFGPDEKPCTAQQDASIPGENRTSLPQSAPSRGTNTDRLLMAT